MMAGEELLSTEFQFSDPYLTLAVYMLHDITQETGDVYNVCCNLYIVQWVMETRINCVIQSSGS